MCHPIFYVLHPLLHAFLETVRVVSLPGVALPEVENAAVAQVVSEDAESGVDVAVAAVVEPEVVFVVDLDVSEPRVVFVVGPEVSEPGVVPFVGPEVSEPEVVFVALFFVADVAEPQASVDIALAFDFLGPVSAVEVEVYSFGRPRFLFSPSIDYSASSSSSVEAVRWESVHSSTVVRTNYGLCSIPSNPDLRQNKNLEHCYNKPSPGYNNVSDTSDLPMDATTSHYRNRFLPERPEQHKHRYQE